MPQEATPLRRQVELHSGAPRPSAEIRSPPDDEDWAAKPQALNGLDRYPIRFVDHEESDILRGPGKPFARTSVERQRGLGPARHPPRGIEVVHFLPLLVQGFIDPLKDDRFPGARRTDEHMQIVPASRIVISDGLHHAGACLSLVHEAVDHPAVAQVIPVAGAACRQEISQPHQAVDGSPLGSQLPSALR